MKGVHSFRFNGIVHKRAVGVTSAPGNKGVIFIRKRTGMDNKPAKSLNKATLNKFNRKTLTSIHNMIKKDRYRRELKLTALRCASAILRGQKPVRTKKGRGGGRGRRGGRGKSGATSATATAASRKKPE